MSVRRITRWVTHTEQTLDKAFRAVAFLILSGLLLVGSGADFAAQAADGGSIIVPGSEHGYLPLSFSDREHKQTSFNIDLRRAIAEVTGLNVNIDYRPWSNFRNDLETGNDWADQIVKAMLLFFLPILIASIVFFLWSWSLRKQVSQRTADIREELEKRKIVETALRQNEAQKKAILDASVDSIRLVDTDMKIIWTNKIIEELIDRDRDDIVGDFCYRVFTGRERPCPDCATEKSMASGEIEHTIVSEMDVKGIAGVSYWAEYAVPIKNDAGEITNFIQVSRDINELKKAEEELKKSEARYRALFDYNPIQTVVVDNDGKITMFNFAGERAGGRMPVVGDVMYEDYARKHEIDMHRELMECISSGSKKTFSELKYHERYLNIQMTPFTEGAIITSEDVTSRKKLQNLLEQMRKMDAVGMLSGGIAHEFNNILGIIVGNVELAMDDVPGDSQTYDFLEEVKNASIRGKDIVRQLLSFTHKDNSKKSPIDLSTVVRDSLKFLRASVPATVGFDEHICAEALVINGDETQIHQVMINLCSNAAQSLDNDSGTIVITLERRDVSEMQTFAGQRLAPGSYARLVITDNGRGIPENIVENIFDPFFTTKSVGEGSGMGLSVVYGIVRGHEGFIEVESSPNRGTAVSCYFPVSGKTVSTGVQIPQYSRGGNERILFVDDEAAIAKMCKERLERLGYEVEATTDPAVALDTFRADPNRYDLVITDMTMPGMPGDHLIREIKKIRNNIQTIICTGYSKMMDEERALLIGSTGYIMKPIDREKMAETVRAVLDQTSN